MKVFPKQQPQIDGEKLQLLRPDSEKNKKKELDEIASETLTKIIDSVEDDKLLLEKLDSFQKRKFSEQIYETLVTVLEKSNRHLSQSDKQKVIQIVSDEILGYGPINSLLEDSSVTEIMVNGFDNVYVERNGKLSQTDISFRDNAHILHVINKIITPLGRRIDESSPTVDARLPDGSRVNAIIAPLSLKGPSLTIRKFAADPFSVDDLIGMGTLTQVMSNFLKSCVRSRANIIVSGGTGSGKTTTLNVLSGFIPDTERIISIEDTAELQLMQNHVVTLESRPANVEGRGQYTIRELVINSLRMRPDRIVIGEVRGAETLDMLQAMNTGHDGSISTLHANNPRDALTRMETMVLMAGMDLPLPAVREQISSAIDLIIHQSRLSDGTRKITRISEVVGMEKDIINLQDIFVFQQSEINEKGMVIGEHKFTGLIPKCIDKLKAQGETACIESLLERYRDEKPFYEQELRHHGNSDRIASAYGKDEEKEQIGGFLEHKEVSGSGRENKFALVRSAENRTTQDDRLVQDTAPESGKGLSSRIPKNMRGISIPVNTLTGLYGHISSGDRVDVIVSWKDQNSGHPPYTAAREAIVLSAGDAANAKEDGQSDTSVILAVTPEQAEALAGSYHRGHFHLLLCPGT